MDIYLLTVIDYFEMMQHNEDFKTVLKNPSNRLTSKIREIFMLRTE